MEHLELGAYTYYRAHRADFKETLARVFELFPRLKERQKQHAGTLSGGEQADAGVRSGADVTTPASSS